MRALVLLLTALSVLGCGRGEEDAAQGYTTWYHDLSDRIVVLPSGDSVEFQGRGPAYVPGEPSGLLITYHPFHEMSDTLGIRALAMEFFWLREDEFRREDVEWVVMRAVGRRAKDRTDFYYTMASYGVVIERRSDGQWYRIGTSEPLRPPIRSPRAGA